MRSPAIRSGKLWPLALAVALAAAARPARTQEPEERADAGRFRARVEAALDADGADRGFWGVLVTDADTGAVIYSLNAGRDFAPASNTKLFTTAMALGSLGPQFRIETKVIGTGPLREGRLEGDLVLVGAGDANLSNRVFPFAAKDRRDGPPEKALAELADEVVGKGLKAIAGDVVADDSYFERGRFPSGWTLDDTVWSYGAAVSAIAVNDNMLGIEVRPGRATGAPVEFSLAPAAGIYQVRSDAKTSAAGTPDELVLWREPESRVFHLGGTLPAGAGRQLEVAVAEPAEDAAAILARLLEERGVQIGGQARARHFGDAETGKGTATVTLAERESPTLLEDVRATNKMSLNLHAELMLRVAAREKAGALTLDDALEYAKEFREKIGIGPGEAQLSDGSGLSRDDLATPEALVKILTWAGKQEWGADFRQTLPVAGEDGTLAERMKNTAAAGRVEAKTGYIDHTEGLSGYATTTRGEHLIFSMLGNGNEISSRAAMSVVDAICVAMVEELGAGPGGGPASTNGAKREPPESVR